MVFANDKRGVDEELHVETVGTVTSRYCLNEFVSKGV
jgi:hypothetical protein